MRVRVQISQSLHGRSVQLRGFSLGNKNVTELIFGNLVCAVNATANRALEREKPILVLSPSVANAFGLTADTDLHLVQHGSVWRLGPVLGLYVDRLPSKDRPFGEQTHMFEELTTYGQAMGVHVVILSPGDVAQRRVMHFDSARKTWRNHERIFPDIVIRRSGSFAKLNAQKAQRELQQLQEKGRLYTLPRASSNKWTLYQVLSVETSLRPFLPRTTLCTSGRDLYRMVMARKDVYLKPPGGAQGISIYHVQQNGNRTKVQWEKRKVSRNTERYTNVFQPQTELKKALLSTQDEFVGFWRRTGMRRCIVQDTVQLPRLNDSPFDFRWLVQASDNPEVIARVARIGQKNAITTNIHTGGQAKKAEDLIEQAVGKDKTTRYIQQMDDIAMTVVRTLAKRYGAFAEVGIDLAISTSGDIYIFEINPTPGRRMLRMLSPDTRRLSLDSMLEYAIRATGYGG
ncbi:YheC/YheD family protein [Alicyclobacillus fodiniaquatilis]|uniref:YheC/YheD family protein n=1 Tax=Alicyclobacillus fodiniaquatilis TaxID=1661150 RepID=A0ABW4JFZ0_9BACL